jgi:hypothetical protein
MSRSEVERETGPETDSSRERWLLATMVLSAVASGVNVFAASSQAWRPGSIAAVAAPQDAATYLLVCVLAGAGRPEDWVVSGSLFLVAAAALAVYSVALLYRGAAPSLLWAGIAGNALAVGLYTVTRTVGALGFGSRAGQVASVGAYDATATLVEVVLIGCLLRLLRAERKGGTAGGTLRRSGLEPGTQLASWDEPPALVPGKRA